MNSLNKEEKKKKIQSKSEKKIKEIYIKEDNFVSFQNNGDKIILNNNYLNKSSNKNFNYRKLPTQQIENSSIKKKLNEFNDDIILKSFKSSCTERKIKFEDEKNKLNDYEKIIVNNNHNLNNQNENDILVSLSETTSTIKCLNDSNDEITKLKKENIQLKQNICELKNQFIKMKSEYLNGKKEQSFQIENLIQKLNNLEFDKINNNSIDIDTIISLKNISEDNNQKNTMIKKLNDCIIEYNQTIIESKNEIYERDEQIELLMKEKNELIEKNNILLNRLIQNKKENDNLNKKIKDLLKENEIKNNQINSLSMLVTNLENDKNMIQMSNNQENEKINSIILSLKKNQLELNNQILLLTKNNSDKDKIINNLNQNLLFFKGKAQENQNKIANFFNIIIEMKKYVFEVEKMINNSKELQKDNKLFENTKNEYDNLSYEEINNIEVSNNEYSNYLLNSLKNMIVKIDSKLNDNINTI